MLTNSEHVTSNKEQPSLTKKVVFYVWFLGLFCYAFFVLLQIDEPNQYAVLLLVGVLFYLGFSVSLLEIGITTVFILLFTCLYIPNSEYVSVTEHGTTSYNDITLRLPWDPLATNIDKSFGNDKFIVTAKSKDGEKMLATVVWNVFVEDNEQAFITLAKKFPNSDKVKLHIENNLQKWFAEYQEGKTADKSNQTDLENYLKKMLDHTGLPVENGKLRVAHYYQKIE